MLISMLLGNKGNQTLYAMYVQNSGWARECEMVYQCIQNYDIQLSGDITPIFLLNSLIDMLWGIMQTEILQESSCTEHINLKEEYTI